MGSLTPSATSGDRPDPATHLTKRPAVTRGQMAAGARAIIAAVAVAIYGGLFSKRSA